MTTEQQIKALAELDGWKPFEHKDTRLWSMVNKDMRYHSYQCGVSEDHCWRVCLPDYLTSYDAIIPLIEKHLGKEQFNYMTFCQAIRNFHRKDTAIFGNYEIIKRFILATPAQLCEALLRATGKWIE